MIDSLTRLLLQKHSPNDPRLADVEPVSKMTIVMDSTKHPESEIAKACMAFNVQHTEWMGRSYQLPTTVDGIAAGSWIIIEESP